MDVIVLDVASRCLLKHLMAWLNLWSRPAPREDKAVFLLRPCILILKVAKNF